MQLARRAGLLGVGIALVCCRRPASQAAPPDRQATAEAKSRFEAFALEPAHQPPLSVELGPTEAVAPGIRGVASLLQPEDADWNIATDGTPLLFNDRWVLLAQIQLEGDDLIWLPQRTSLELNSPEISLQAAPVPDDVLGDLLYWALQEERAGLGDGLVARTRGAGAFRSAYLRQRADGSLSGVVAFPAVDNEGTHVVAARLTVAVAGPSGEQELVWVFH